MNRKRGFTRVSVLFVVATFVACGGCGGGDGATTGTPPSGNTPPSVTTPPSGTVEFAATFPDPGPFRTDQLDGMSNDGVWYVEQKAPGRAVVANVGRDGGTGLRLHTEPGDDNVSGSGAYERNDVALIPNDAYGKQGMEQWWAHSVLFPDDYAIPSSGSPAIVFDFHDTRNKGGYANFHIFVWPGGLLAFRGYAGPTVIMEDNGNQYIYGAEIGPLVRNVWYDFVYHVKWSSGSDGFFQAWVNGVLKLDHHGPTLYQDYGVFLKLANYHPAFGQSSSVVHDRIIRGTTWQAVSLTPLAGV
ncbi:MAG TPA: heparin lyase I family protein [Burkholderiales bacterium]|nr:heparin lyase I family protein [Burkholderiales bacterium]